MSSLPLLLYICSTVKNITHLNLAAFNKNEIMPHLIKEFYKQDLPGDGDEGTSRLPTLAAPLFLS